MTKREYCFNIICNQENLIQVVTATYIFIFRFHQEEVVPISQPHEDDIGINMQPEHEYGDVCD